MALVLLMPTVQCDGSKILQTEIKLNGNRTQSRVVDRSMATLR